MLNTLIIVSFLSFSFSQLSDFVWASAGFSLTDQSVSFSIGQRLTEKTGWLSIVSLESLPVEKSEILELNNNTLNTDNGFQTINSNVMNNSISLGPTFMLYEKLSTFLTLGINKSTLFQKYVEENDETSINHEFWNDSNEVKFSTIFNIGFIYTFDMRNSIGHWLVKLMYSSINDKAIISVGAGL